MIQVHPLADLFPLLEGAEFDRLCADIKANGLLQPITLLGDCILDGRNRKRACERVGVPIRSEQFSGDSPLRFVLSANLHRRHLDESQRAMVAAKLANMGEGRPKTASIEAVSQQQAAKMLKVGRASLQRAKNVYAKAVPELVRRVEQGEVVVSVAAKVADLPEIEQQKFAQASESVLRTQSPRAYARRQARAAEPIPDGKEYRIGDCREVLADIAPDSVALILTDPPYADEADPLFEWLAEFAARTLIPGGSLIVFTGSTALLRRGMMFEKYLRYWWPISMAHTQPQRMFGRGVLVWHKPVLWFVKEERRAGSLVPDVMRPKERDKDLHPWSQSDGGIQPLIEHLTEPGELIVDPFAGSGVWGNIAHSLNRLWIGADIVRCGSTISESRGRCDVSYADAMADEATTAASS